MNCLTYLLDLWKRNHRFNIYYDGNHCFGMNESKLFDLNNTFKLDFMAGNSNYILIENCHTKEVIKKIFSLGEEQYELLKQYYDR